MIYLYQNNKEYDYDVRAIALAFFEREKIIELEEKEWAEKLSGKETPTSVKKRQEPAETSGQRLFLRLDYSTGHIEGTLQ